MEERIPPAERRTIAREKRQRRLEAIRSFVVGLWKGRGR